MRAVLIVSIISAKMGQIYHRHSATFAISHSDHQVVILKSPSDLLEQGVKSYSFSFVKYLNKFCRRRNLNSRPHDVSECVEYHWDYPHHSSS